MSLSLADSLQVQGKFILERVNPETGLVIARHESANLITRLGRNLVARLLLDVSGYDTGLTYQAIGDGTDTVLTRDIKLANELVRRRMTLRQDTSGTTAAFITYFPAEVLVDVNDNPIVVEELGVFGHTTAGSGVDTGVMFARALLSTTLVADEDVNISYVLTVA